MIAAANNHYKGQAAVNAVDIKRLLGVKDNPVPDPLLEAYPQLKGESAEGGTSSAAQPTGAGRKHTGKRVQGETKAGSPRHKR